MTTALNKLKYCWPLVPFVIIYGLLYLLNSGWIGQPKKVQFYIPLNKHVALWNCTNYTNVTLQPVTDRCIKILFWNSYYDWSDFHFGYGRQPFVDKCTTAAGFTHRCCETTSNRKELESSDAVVFHIRDIIFQDFPKKRRPEQVWVFFLKEPPTLTNIRNNKKPKLNGKFNWTMTYRRDSDVPNPYFKIIRTCNMSNETANNVTNLLTGKQRLVAWLVSNCKTSSKREKYVKQLKKYVPVDVYGGCGKKCPGKSKSECLDFVFSNYKFYLSFENSRCKDYVTEKFINALERGVVPIVYGGADYNAIAPPNSFINTKDFKSPQQLAEYIRLLDSDDALYLDYFQWRQDFKVTPQIPFCHLCDKLHQTDMGISSNHKVYDDMVSWWYKKGNCH